MNALKSYLALCLLILSISQLNGELVPKFKGSGSLGYVSGVIFGIGVTNTDKPKRERYLNAILYKIDGLTIAGINHETRFLLSKKYYTLITAGSDFVAYKLTTTYANPNLEDTIEYGSWILPHLTAGIGYQTVLVEGIHLFIEWDLGIKPSISNINIGITF